MAIRTNTSSPWSLLARIHLVTILLVAKMITDTRVIQVARLTMGPRWFESISVIVQSNVGRQKCCINGCSTESDTSNRWEAFIRNKRRPSFGGTTNGDLCDGSIMMPRNYHDKGGMSMAAACGIVPDTSLCQTISKSMAVAISEDRRWWRIEIRNWHLLSSGVLAGTDDKMTLAAVA